MGEQSHSRRARGSLWEGQTTQSYNLPGENDSRAEIWTNARVCCQSTLLGHPLLAIGLVLGTNNCCQGCREIRKENAVGWGNVRNKIQPVLFLVFPDRLTWQITWKYITQPAPQKLLPDYVYLAATTQDFKQHCNDNKKPKLSVRCKMLYIYHIYHTD